MESSAVFSECRTYRYQLTRRWGEGPILNVIGLNPSTADETQDDPTIRRCIGFAKAWGYSTLVMTNLFGYRSTDPKGLTAVDDPIGPRNDCWIRISARQANLVLAAWGASPLAIARGQFVVATPSYPIRFHCLGLTKGGAPRHPLYIKATTRAMPFILGDGARIDETGGSDG